MEEWRAFDNKNPMGSGITSQPGSWEASLNSTSQAKPVIRKLGSPTNKIFWFALYRRSSSTQWALGVMMWSPALDVEDTAVFCRFALGSVQDEELDEMLPSVASIPLRLACIPRDMETPRNLRPFGSDFRTWNPIEFHTTVSINFGD
jgi:hypothetical protein